ncbi:hypothetical protein OYE22_08400 [Streptomyces sp. 71268]|uniref:hypothetical protein n=1 Tax=Streptomyces sp. 71268 TaxID=3002640 RepID=UPI0023F692E2|nr:hypothetical protein [Streptomyces sp. 71268]WEV25208.1 hypothetical protein OYE22_08400 [Streptomyces sp. 71268]
MPGWVPLTTLVVALTLATCLCASISTRARIGSLWTHHARWWGDGALLCALLASLAYGYGIYEATAIDSDARVVCAAERSASGGVPEGAAVLSREVAPFPLRAQCRWTDGTFDAVPGWVNPSVYVALAGATLCAGTVLVRHELAQHRAVRAARAAEEAAETAGAEAGRAAAGEAAGEAAGTERAGA